MDVEPFIEDLPVGTVFTMSRYNFAQHWIKISESTFTRHNHHSKYIYNITPKLHYYKIIK